MPEGFPQISDGLHLCPCVQMQTGNSGCAGGIRRRVGFRAGCSGGQLVFPFRTLKCRSYRYFLGSSVSPENRRHLLQLPAPRQKPSCCVQELDREGAGSGLQSACRPSLRLLILVRASLLPPPPPFSGPPGAFSPENKVPISYRIGERVLISGDLTGTAS